MTTKGKTSRRRSKRPEAPAIIPMARGGRRVAPIKGRLERIRDDSEGFPRPLGARFEVTAKADATEIELYDVIGMWGVSAKRFHETLKAVKTPVIRLRINSPGGDVFDGIAMFNDLVNHPARVEVTVTGLAASAASLVAMAGDSVAIAANAFFMIHNAWVALAGDRRDMAKAARVLERIDAALARTYQQRTGLTGDEITEMMDDETWLDAAESLALGFADEISSVEQDVKAIHDLSCYMNVPAVLREVAKAAPAPAPETVNGSDLLPFIAAVQQLCESVKGTPNDRKGPSYPY